MQMTPAAGNGHKGNFRRFDAEIFGDSLRDASERNLGSGGGVRFEGIGYAFEFRGEVLGRSH